MREQPDTGISEKPAALFCCWLGVWGVIVYFLWGAQEQQGVEEEDDCGDCEDWEFVAGEVFVVSVG